jgi:hypothetical protein
MEKNRKISNGVGLITGLSILCLVLVLHKMGVSPLSPVALIQFAVLMLGVFISSALLYKFYTGIQFSEAFSHNAKTVATTTLVVIVGNILLHFMLNRSAGFDRSMTFMIMKTIFAYTFSGLLSAFFSTYIFYTFTKK